MILFNHAFSLGFEVVHPNPAGEVPSKILLACLLKRIANLIENAELIEACGCPTDSFEEEQRGYWDDHPDYPGADWRHEVENGDTRQSYQEWVVTQREGKL